MKEIVLNYNGTDYNVPFQSLNANLKIQLKSLKKEQGKELNEKFDELANTLEKLSVLHNAKAKAGELKFAEILGDYSIKDYSEITDLVQKGENPQMLLVNMVNETLEEKHLIEYVKTCVDTNYIKKKNDKALLKVVETNEFWYSIDYVELENIKNSF